MEKIPTDQKFKQNLFPAEISSSRKCDQSDLPSGYDDTFSLAELCQPSIEVSNERRLLNLDKFAGSSRVSVSFCVDLMSLIDFLCSSKLIGHPFWRTRQGDMDSYQLTFIDDEEAYSTRISSNI